VNTAYLYRVVAQNTVGYGGAYASVTVQSTSDPALVGPAPTAGPLAPSLLTATLQAGPQVRLQWRDNANNEGGFVIERRVLGVGQFAQVAVAPPRGGVGNVTFTDTTIQPATQYEYQVAAVNLFGGVPTLSAYSNVASTAASDPLPAAPSNLTAVNGANQGTKRSVVLSWTDNSTNESGFSIQRATNAAFTTGLNTSTVTANAITVTQTGLSKATTYYFRIRANNAVGSSAWVNATPFPIVTNP
jgi:predicted phage tail protein